MRTQKEMLALILKVAKEDERIRLVGLNGSRTNENAPVDIFQDYDIAYLVTDMQAFIEQRSWLDVFGERIIMQVPEDMSLFSSELGNRYSYLMLFEDGNRIDLMLIPVEEKETYLSEDSLTEILLDKDDKIAQLSTPSDQDYWVKAPTTDDFRDCCNEFWWLSTYVAKGLWRRELNYVQDHMQLMRSMLIQMLAWQIGARYKYSVSLGKNGKYLEKFLSQKTWQAFVSTYTNGNYGQMWPALYQMCDLFLDTSAQVSEINHYEANRENYAKVYQYLKDVEALPRHASTLY